MAKEPDYATLKKQIRTALDNYTDLDPKAAMLSGISLAATFLAKCEGGTMRPQSVVSAAAEIATEMGYGVGRLSGKLPPVNIGSVVVIPGFPTDGNPWKELSKRPPNTLSGDARLDALRRFYLGQPVPECTFWYTPATAGAGGMRHIIDRAEINWSTTRFPEEKEDA